MSQTAVTPSLITPAGRLSAHISLLRLDHSVKHIFVVPGIVLAMSLSDTQIGWALLVRILIGLSAIVAVASSNYVLNELLDAPYDRLHPTKCLRPAALRTIKAPLAYAQWLVCAAVGFLLAAAVSNALLFTVLALWIMGCLYNIPPVRTKDIVYLDVLSESINNPIRLCAGWYIVRGNVFPPISLLIAYWLMGAYLMALKRFSEYREIGRGTAAQYRRSFEFYNEKALLTSAFIYAVASMFFLGAFVVRYRIEMILALPLVILLMAAYFRLSFLEESPVQHPEKLYREPYFMVLIGICSTALVVTSFVHIPWLMAIVPRTLVQ